MEPFRDRFRAEAARGGMDIDRAAYERAGRDPLEPILLGSGALDAPLGILGRDPGRTEVELAEPFVGPAGQLVRRELHRALGRPGEPDLAASIEAGRGVFWCNTVPYKPAGNRAWPVAVKRRFAPILAEIVGELWTGSDLLTLGNDAFAWLGIAEPSLRPTLRAFWARPDRYEAMLEVPFRGRCIRVWPLPHPSPLNARWYRRFPEMMRRRLAEIGWPRRGGAQGDARRTDLPSPV